jgi:hypothetical protein
MLRPSVIANEAQQSRSELHGCARNDRGRRLAIACIASLLIYVVVFGLVLDRPLSLGFLRHQIDTKLARAATIAGPKLVLLAGSNAPYSHRCETIEPILGMPCVNGGVAVGIGLDYLFARWKPLLHAGDILYLPMEEEQYGRTRSATDMGPDAAIMLRHDRHTLFTLYPDRWLAAFFSFDLRAAIMSPIEFAMVAAHFHDPRPEVTGATNAWGDHIGHTAQLGLTNQAVLAATTPQHVSAQQVRTGYGSALIADFTRWASAHGMRVIGGLPTEFADSPTPDATIQAIRNVYLANGGEFLGLPNLSRYPRTAFFDSAEHLNETWQIEHSKLLASQLRWLRAPIATAHQAGPASLPAPRNTQKD